MQVHFDTRTADPTATPTILLTTDDGVLLGTSAEAAAGQQGKQTTGGMSELVSISDGLVSFAVEPLSGSDVFCLTDAECILYLHRASLS